MISLVTRIMHDNGNICDIEVETLTEGKVFYIKFCNNKTMQLSSSRYYVSVNYDSKKYRYMMKDEDAYFDPDVKANIVSLGQRSFLKINIKKA